MLKTLLVSKKRTANTSILTAKSCQFSFQTTIEVEIYPMVVSIRLRLRMGSGEERGVSL
jgi:hypothetical protein